MDEVIQGIQTLGVKDPGGGHTFALGVAKKIGGIPLCIQLVETDDITLRATKLGEQIRQDAETHAKVMKMRTYDYVDKMLFDMQGKMDELNMKYFGEMYSNLEKTFGEINGVLAENREEMKRLAYKTQNEGAEEQQ